MKTKTSIKVHKSDFSKGFEDRIINYKRYYTTLLIFPSDVLNDGSCWVYVQVTVVVSEHRGNKVTDQKLRRKFNTGVAVDPEHWDSEKEVSNDFKANGRIRALRGDIETTITRILDDDVFEKATDDLLKLQDLFKSAKKKEKIRMKGVVTYVEEYIQYRKDQKTTRGTLKEYTTLLNRLKRYELDSGETITFDSINLTLSDRLLSHWGGVMEYHPNTIKKCFELLGTVLSYYYDRKEELGLTITDKFKHKKFGAVNEVSTDPLPLNDIEIEAVNKFDCKKWKLEEIKRIEGELKKGKLESHKKEFYFANAEKKYNQFVLTQKQIILQCATGLRVSDLFTVNAGHIKQGMIILKAKKTRNTKEDSTVYIPLNPASIRILKPLNYDSNKLKISATNYNANIKEFLKAVGVNTPVEVLEYKGLVDPTSSMQPKYSQITTHCCRDTYISKCVRENVPIPMILRATGQSSYEVMRRYIRLENSEMISKMGKLFK